MLKRVIILFPLITFCFLNLHSQNPELKTTLGRDSAMIGEQFEYTIEFSSPTPLHSIIPLDDRMFSGNVEIISQISDSTVNDNQHSYKMEYLITSFDSGNYRINSIPVLVNDFKKLDTFYTETHEFNIYMPAVDTTAAIKDIKDPVNTPFKLAELLPYLPWIIAFIAAIAILLVVLIFIRKKKQKEIPEPALPPDEKAIQELDRIKKEKIWKKGQVKEYYSQLSDTIRNYIEERYNIPAMESVTWEILEDFRKFAWDDESLMELLESLLQLSDLVKFAKEAPTPLDNETHLNNAYIFVEKTRESKQVTEKTVEKV